MIPLFLQYINHLLLMSVHDLHPTFYNIEKLIRGFVSREKEEEEEGKRGNEYNGMIKRLRVFYPCGLHQ